LKNKENDSKYTDEKRYQAMWKACSSQALIEIADLQANQHSLKKHEVLSFAFTWHQFGSKEIQLNLSTATRSSN
jgi:hypothetical protein